MNKPITYMDALILGTCYLIAQPFYEQGLATSGAIFILSFLAVKLHIHFWQENT